MTGDAGKRNAGRAAAELVETGMRVGLGTGSTAFYFVERLGERILEGLRIEGVPTSERTAEQARRVGISLLPWDDDGALDLACDGADEVDPNGLLIKGLGGALVREKRVALRARRFVVMVDESKLVAQLGARCPIPVEFRPGHEDLVRDSLETLRARPILRLQGEVPYRSDNDNFIYDAWFSKIADPADLEQTIDMIPGVVGNGLFVGLTHTVLVGTPAGVQSWEVRSGV